MFFSTVTRFAATEEQTRTCVVPLGCMYCVQEVLVCHVVCWQTPSHSHPQLVTLTRWIALVTNWWIRMTFGSVTVPPLTLPMCKFMCKCSLARPTERIGGPRTKSKSGTHNIDCVRGGNLGTPPWNFEILHALKCVFWGPLQNFTWALCTN